MSGPKNLEALGFTLFFSKDLGVLGAEMILHSARTCSDYIADSEPGGSDFRVPKTWASVIWQYPLSVGVSWRYPAAQSFIWRVESWASNLQMRNYL